MTPLSGVRIQEASPQEAAGRPPDRRRLRKPVARRAQQELAVPAVRAAELPGSGSRSYGAQIATADVGRVLSRARGSSATGLAFGREARGEMAVRTRADDRDAERIQGVGRSFGLQERHRGTAFLDLRPMFDARGFD